MGNMIDPPSLMDPTNVSSNGTSTAVTGLQDKTVLMVQLEVGTVPNGSTNTLDVYVQTSYDFGTTWADLGHYQFTTAAENVTMWFTRPLDMLLRGHGHVVPALPMTNCALPGNTVSALHFGERIRLAWVYAQGDSSGGPYNLGAGYLDN